MELIEVYNRAARDGMKAYRIEKWGVGDGFTIHVSILDGECTISVNSPYDDVHSDINAEIATLWGYDLSQLSFDKPEGVEAGYYIISGIDGVAFVYNDAEDYLVFLSKLERVINEHFKKNVSK